MQALAFVCFSAWPASCCETDVGRDLSLISNEEERKVSERKGTREKCSLATCGVEVPFPVSSWLVADQGHGSLFFFPRL